MPCCASTRTRTLLSSSARDPFLLPRQPPPERSWLMAKAVSGPIWTALHGFNSCHPPSTKRAFFLQLWSERAMKLVGFCAPAPAPAHPTLVLRTCRTSHPFPCTCRTSHPFPCPARATAVVGGNDSRTHSALHPPTHPRRWAARAHAHAARQHGGQTARKRLTGGMPASRAHAAGGAAEEAQRFALAGKPDQPPRPDPAQPPRPDPAQPPRPDLAQPPRPDPVSQ